MKKTISYILKTGYSLPAAAVFLYLLSFLFENTFFLRGNTNQELSNLRQYIHAGQQRLEDFATDTAKLAALTSRQYSASSFQKITEDKTGFFIYSKNELSPPRLLFWSNQYIIPSAELIYGPDGDFFYKLANGYYTCMVRSVKIKNGDFKVIGLVPVLYDYFVETEYLPNEFAHNKKAAQKIRLGDSASAYKIKSISGKTLFTIEPLASLGTTAEGAVAIGLKFISVLLLLIFLHKMAEKIADKKGHWAGIAFLVLVVFIFRLAGYLFQFPMNMRQFDLFDPAVYGTNAIHKSLGDLLINVLLFLWLVYFIRKKINQAGSKEFASPFHHTAGKIITAIILVGFTFLMAATIRSLAADSNISFDVINFFTLNQFTIFGFAALSMLATGYYFLVRVLMGYMEKFYRENFNIGYLAVAVSGLVYLSFLISSPQMQFFLLSLLWLVLLVYLFRLSRLSVNKGKLNMAQALFWIFYFSVSITAILIDANREKEWELRKRLADKIDVQSDPYNERQLSIAFAYIDDEFLSSNFSRFRNSASAKYLRDSILRESGYLNMYDSRLYVYDENNKPLYNDDPESANTLNTIISLQAKQTHTPHLYYYETAFDKFTFIFFREVRDARGRKLGSLFILSNPEHYSGEAFYPELFRLSNQANPQESQVYSFGIYKKGILLTSPVNKYSFATELLATEIPQSQFEKRIRGDYAELWYRSSQEKIVVIAKKKESVIEAITLFSYIFCAFLFLVAIASIVAVIIRVGGNWKELRTLMQWNIRTQVHGTIIFISILSFIIIGIATISFFIQRYEQNNRDKLSRTMEIVVSELGKELAKQQVFDDQLAIYDSVSNQDVQKLVNEISEIHEVDVNIYDTSGTLHVTSRPLIYREGFLSTAMHPLAYYHLHQLRQVQHVQQEQLATIGYLSIYAPLRGDDGITYAYLNIPYFLSQRELKQEISNFLVTIINLNAFIFLIAGVIAVFITNRVTRSFSLISEKMQEVNLGKANEEINWSRDDEIGGLVREYNKMVRKLEVSAEALARSEREGAWREMARQVAHEIKNPLTPMKLSIQYLQKSIDNNSVNVKELTANVAKTLVEQIDHLSKIAFDFSQFANIGNTNPEKFDLRNVLQSLADLFRVNENAELQMSELPGEIFLYTDKTQMNRLFTNLFQNAIEACIDDKKGRVLVKADITGDTVTVSVSDNGEGIPEEMQSKIFVPNFTTKSSGTGLGLAICKGIVEKAGGKIWFETKKGEGSTFYVMLPLADKN